MERPRSPFRTLPEGYYLIHFNNFLNHIEKKCRHLLSADQIEMLTSIKSLNDNEKMLYARLVNRSGKVFNLLKLSYNEINDIFEATKVLKLNNLLKNIDTTNINQLISSLTKPELLDYLEKALPSISQLRSKTKPEVFEAASKVLKIEDFSDLQNYFVFERDDINYLIFLYYGRFETSLNTQTLSDLGLRSKNKFKASNKSVRYKTLEEAQTTYLIKKIRKADLVDDPSGVDFKLVQRLASDPDLSEENKLDFDKLTLAYLKVKSPKINDENKLQWLSLGFGPEVFKKFLNQSYKMNSENAEKIALESIDNPQSLDHLLIAESFLNIKFNGEKRTEKTNQLLSAETIEISSKQRPEKSVKDYFQSQGFKAYRSENFLWTSLFGILFWEELFSSSKASFHSEFDLLPESLITNSFYEGHQEAIETKLHQLKDMTKIKKNLLETICKNYGTRNGVFKWHPSTGELMLNFLEAAQLAKPESILRNMAQNFKDNKSGYPDIYYIKDNKVTFVEVKAEGDSLSDKQFRQIKVLNDANFEAKILRTVWKPDADQSYVVIDVETTGGNASKSRVTEVGAVKIKNGVEVGRFQSLVNPQTPIPRNIIRLTGITNQMVSTAPLFKEIANDFREFCGDSVFVAHNVNFDYSFIKEEFLRAGVFYRAEKLCTCSEMRKSKKGLTSYSLKNLSHHFGIELKNHHRALDDALAASQLLRILLKSDVN